MHYLNDELLNILVTLAGLTFFDGDDKQPSKSDSTGLDATLGYESVPLVHVEENRANIAPGVGDLRRKLRWIPNLNLVPFIFGIAITVTEIQIWKLTKAGMTDECPIYQSMLNSDLERMKALVAIVHCASVLKYYITNHLTFPGSGLKFNVWHKRISDKSIKLSGDTVFVQYDNIEKYNKMLSFYSLTHGDRHIEHMAFSNSCNATSQRFSLQPLGVNRLPYKVQEFLNVLVCVATALHDLHNLMFCHTDLRWSNIVWVSVGFVFEAEFEAEHLRLDCCKVV